MHVAMGVAYSCLKNGVFITTGSYALQFVNNTVKAHFVTYCIGNSIVSFSTIAKWQALGQMIWTNFPPFNSRLLSLPLIYFDGLNRNSMGPDLGS